MIERMYYCGQIDSHGHYIWTSYPSRPASHLSMSHFEADCPFGALDDPDRWCGRAEGEAKLTHIKGWTVFGFREYSIDTRPGSHSTFAAKGTHTAEEMEREARRLFPDVWARFKFPITMATRPMETP